MRIQSSVGRSYLTNAAAAGSEAAKQAVVGLSGERPILIMVFSSVVYDQRAMIDGVKSVTGDAPLIGCSTAGEIITDGPSKKSVAVMAIAGDGVRFHLGKGEHIKEDPIEAGRSLGRAFKTATDKGRIAIMLPDGLAGNGADVVRGVQRELGEHFLIAGGSAGDDFLFQKTYEYYNGEVLSGAVVGILVEGDVKFGIGVRHGWKPIGRGLTVTKSEGSVLYELDGKPAATIYEEYFGKRAEELKLEPLARIAITYPLGLRIPRSDEYLIRDPITVGDKGEITCAAEVPVGSEIKMMLGSKANAIAAAKEAATQCLEGVRAQGGVRVTTAIIFNCIARNKVLAQNAGDEIKTIKQTLGEKAQMIGFYTYGEQAPIGGSVVAEEKPRRAEFCNETVVIVGFGE